MICLKDKSTMAISCHLILVVGFLFISFLFFCQCLVSEQCKVFSKGSCYCCSPSFRSESFSFFILVQFFCILFCFLFGFFYNHSHCQRHQQHVATLVKCDLCNKKKQKHVYWGCDTTGDPERLFRLCNQSTMCKCYHFFSLKEERCLYRVNLCALKEMCFFKV